MRSVNKLRRLVQWERDFKLKKLLRFIFSLIHGRAVSFQFVLQWLSDQSSSQHRTHIFFPLPSVSPPVLLKDKQGKGERAWARGLFSYQVWHDEAVRVTSRDTSQFCSALWLFSNSITGVVTMFAFKMCLSAITLFSPRGKAFHGTISFVSLVCWQPVTHELRNQFAHVSVCSVIASPKLSQPNQRRDEAKQHLVWKVLFMIHR